MTPLMYHQTVRLGRGAHSSPAEGACVMELASLLAGEPFSDRPACVSPVVAGFLRAYNDLLDDRRRQDLRESASAAVGSRADRRIEAERARRCIEWTAARRPRSRPGLLTKLLVRAGRQLDAAGTFAGAAAWGVRRTDAVHADVLGFVDELIAMGSTPELPSQRSRTARWVAVPAS
jgi:hypothetical protein